MKIGELNIFKCSKQHLAIKCLLLKQNHRSPCSPCLKPKLLSHLKPTCHPYIVRHSEHTVTHIHTHTHTQMWVLWDKGFCLSYLQLYPQCFLHWWYSINIYWLTTLTPHLLKIKTEGKPNDYGIIREYPLLTKEQTRCYKDLKKTPCHVRIMRSRVWGWMVGALESHCPGRSRLCHLQAVWTKKIIDLCLQQGFEDYMK